jgi:hypothetical protein
MYACIGWVSVVSMLLQTGFSAFIKKQKPAKSKNLTFTENCK